MYALQSEATKRHYPRRLKVFFDFCLNNSKDLNYQAIQFVKNGKDNSWVCSKIINFILYQKERMNKGDIAAGTVRNYIKAIKLFCEMNNIILNWKIISKGLPVGPQNTNDRIPDEDEILEVLKYPDRRIKPVLYTMISSGIRIGAWEWLKWKNIIPTYDDKKAVIAAKIIVYDGELEQYFSFITPEAYWSLREWMEFREKQGEKITKESYLMRDIWNTGKILVNSRESNLTKGITGIPSIPKKAGSNAIRQIFTRAWKIQNIRPPDSNITRHEFKSTHCFRKFFETRAMKSMKLLNVKILMGHDTGPEKNHIMSQRNKNFWRII